MTDKRKSVPEKRDVERTNGSDLGIDFDGSHAEGHKIHLTRDYAITDIFGTECNAQSTTLLGHCLKVLAAGEAGDGTEVDDARLFMASVVKDIGPRDSIERMLAVQMTATYMATIRMASCLANSTNSQFRQMNTNCVTKLARTFTTQMEALRKHRNGGKQTVTVQHVNVEGGGQAIVGTVETRGRCKDEK